MFLTPCCLILFLTPCCFMSDGKFQGRQSARLCLSLTEAAKAGVNAGIR